MKVMHMKYFKALTVFGVVMVLAVSLYNFANVSPSRQGYVPLDNGQPCEDTLNHTWQENWKTVLNYPVMDSEPYLADLGLVGPYTDDMLKTEALPVIVTAASSNHHSESLNLLAQLKAEVFPITGPLNIVFYDLGLTQHERMKVQQSCGCKVIDFPYDKYPSHVRNIRGFAWKPIAIQTALKKHGFVMWMDSSTRILTPETILRAFDKVRKFGLGTTYSGAGYSLAQSTDLRTMESFNEAPCVFKNVSEYFATFIIVHKSEFVLRYIMRPWLSCALTDGCMSMSRDSHEDCDQSLLYYGACHRFDQSALSIILHRLHGGKTKNVNFNKDFRWTKCGFTSFTLVPNFVNEFVLRLVAEDRCKSYI